MLIDLDGKCLSILCLFILSSFDLVFCVCVDQETGHCKLIVSLLMFPNMPFISFL